MGRQINLDEPLSEEDKNYLKSRGRGHQIHANERRFGVDGRKDPAEHEAAGVPTASQFYDSQERDRAVYDVGGVPLPGTMLSYDTGRVADRDNGQFVEPEQPLHSPGQFAHRSSVVEEGFSGEPDEGDVDDDIAETVQGLSEAALNKQLKEAGIGLTKANPREQREDALAIYLHDKRHGTTTTPGEPYEQVNPDLLAPPAGDEPTADDSGDSDSNPTP